MKRKVVKTLLSVSVAASMALSAPAAAWASEETAQTESTEAGAETESEADAAAEEEPEDIQIALSDGDLTIKNQTTRTFTEAEREIREFSLDSRLMRQKNICLMPLIWPTSWRVSLPRYVKTEL